MFWNKAKVLVIIVIIFVSSGILDIFNLWVFSFRPLVLQRDGKGKLRTGNIDNECSWYNLITVYSLV